MAKIIIVDKNDKEIGLKERDEVLPSDIYRCTGLWLTNSNGDVLLAQRSFNKSHSPGCWGPAVAGTVEEGETYDSNIQKEIAEELGVTGLDLEKGPHLYSERKHKKFVQYFLAMLDKPAEEFDIQYEEVEQVKWFDPEEVLLDLKVYPENYTPSIEHMLTLFIE